MFSSLLLFAYCLEHNRSMNHVSLGWPLILIFRLQPPSTASCSLTTSYHSHRPLWIVLQEKQYTRLSWVHQSKNQTFFSLQCHVGGFYMTPPFQREYVYEPFLLVNHLFPIRCPCYETWGLGGGRVNSFSAAGPWWMAAQLYAPKLTRGRLYFSFIARRSPASAWELSGPRLSVSSAGPEEEYLIRCNAIRVIWFQKHL